MFKENNFGLNVERVSFYCFGTVITKSLVIKDVDSLLEEDHGQRSTFFFSFI